MEMVDLHCDSLVAALCVGHPRVTSACGIVEVFVVFIVLHESWGRSQMNEFVFAHAKQKMFKV